MEHETGRVNAALVTNLFFKDYVTLKSRLKSLKVLEKLPISQFQQKTCPRFNKKRSMLNGSLCNSFKHFIAFGNSDCPR